MSRPIDVNGAYSCEYKTTGLGLFTVEMRYMKKQGAFKKNKTAYFSCCSMQQIVSFCEATELFSFLCIFYFSFENRIYIYLLQHMQNFTLIHNPHPHVKTIAFSI